MESTNVLVANEENGNTKNVQNQNSNESMMSTMFPYHDIKNMLRKRPLVSDKESGRIISPIDFYLCMMAVLLLCSSAGLTGITGWLILYRLPFLYLTDGSFFMESTSFTLFGCLISVPCCWIAWMCHYDRKNYTFLPLLIVALGFSLSMLSIGISVGLVHKSKVSFDRTVHPPQLRPSHYKTELNNTMSTAMALYNKNTNYRFGWDKIQQRLKCCGIKGPRDWQVYGEMPYSCYTNTRCRNAKFVYLRGCIDILSYELAWETCLITGLSMITFAIQLITLFLAIIVYVKQKVRRGNDDDGS